MDTIWMLLLSLAVGTACGYLLFRLKVPGGMIVGALIGVAALNIFFGKAYLPSFARTVTQVLAGAYVASTVSREDMKSFPRLVKPYLLVILSYLVLNIGCGLLIHAITPGLDLLTAFMCCVPGGITDIPIIAADMGADVTKVAAMQFVRMAVGMSLFPSLISLITHLRSGKGGAAPKKEKKKGTWGELAVTLAIAGAFGALGKLSGIPAGTILFAIVSVLIFKLAGGKTYIPIGLRRVAQVLTGVYIGTRFTSQNVEELIRMWPAALILIGAYSVNCVAMGFVTSRMTHLTRAEAMLVSTPAGASDIALVSADMGITNPEVSVLHIMRMITVVTVFPHILSLFINLFGGLF